MRFVSTLRQPALLLSLLLVYGCKSGGSSGTPEGPIVEPFEVDTTSDTLLIEQPALQWAACEEAAVLECTTLVVPMDYSNPSGETINVRMSRARADSTTRQRTLLLNPGGPGGGGVGFLESVVRFADVPTAIKQSHDFVSFDPRGIGQSTPVECNLNALFRQDSYPVTRAEIQQNLNLTREFAQQCFNDEGSYLQQLGTVNVVRDMNEMRKALGISQFDFLGYSYGSRLAALYMQTFPESTGRFILDGSVAPDSGVATTFQGGLIPAQRNLDELAAACIGITTLCDPDEFSQKLQSKADEIGVGPDTFEAALFFAIVRFASERPGFEQLLIGGLARYLDTDDIEELEFLINFLGLNEELEDQSIFNVTTYFSVLCADDPIRPTIETIESLQASFNADSDLLAESLYGTAGLCAGWPASIIPMPQIATNQAPPSLVIGGSTDAQTSLIFSQQMAAAVGGQFLRSEHDGHTTVFSGRNRCTESAVEVFLTSGELPTTAVCEASPFRSSDERWYAPMMRAPL